MSIDANNICGWAMSQSLVYDETEIWHGHPFCYADNLDDILMTPNDLDIGYCVEDDVKYSDEITEKTKIFSFCPEKKVSPQKKFNEYVNEMKANFCQQNKKLKCDWTHKENY